MFPINSFVDLISEWVVHSVCLSRSGGCPKPTTTPYSSKSMGTYFHCVLGKRAYFVVNDDGNGKEERLVNGIACTKVTYTYMYTYCHVR